MSSNLADLSFRWNKLCAGKTESRPKFRSISNKVHSIDSSLESLKAIRNAESAFLSQNFKLNNLKNTIKVVDYDSGYLEEQLSKSDGFSNDYKFNCRIWLSGECDPDNPLISPCKWSGTMQYIHVDWVKEWLRNKMISKKTEFYTSMAWENIHWELCKTKFPDYVRIKGKPLNNKHQEYYDEGEDQLIELIDIGEQDNNCPYVMLDCINVTSFRKSSSKVVYFIKMSADTVILGRGQVAHVRLADISISRKHTIFRLARDKQIYITDENSKFGTLILQQAPLDLWDKKYEL